MSDSNPVVWDGKIVDVELQKEIEVRSQDAFSTRSSQKTHSVFDTLLTGFRVPGDEDKGSSDEVVFRDDAEGVFESSGIFLGRPDEGRGEEVVQLRFGDESRKRGVDSPVVAMANLEYHKSDILRVDEILLGKRKR